MATSTEDSPRLHVLRGKQEDDFVDFWEWLSPTTGIKSKALGWLAFLGLFMPILAAAFGIAFYIIGISKSLKLAFDLPFALTLQNTLRLSYLAQILVIFVLLFRGALVKLEDDKRFEFGNEGRRLIKKWWSFALYSFAALYVCQLLRLGVSQPNHPMQYAVLEVVSNLCNNGSTLAFLMCFGAMQEPSKDQANKMQTWVQVWFACLMLLTFAEGLFRWFQTATTTLPPSAGSIDWFDLLTGANAGIALAMFCGRIASPLINTPLSVMALLYFYAVIQISFGFWGQHEGVALVMANLCLVLKVLLASVITWLLSTRHLMFYMERIQQTRSHLDEWRKEFRSSEETINVAGTKTA